MQRNPGGKKGRAKVTASNYSFLLLFSRPRTNAQGIYTWFQLQSSLRLLTSERQCGILQLQQQLSGMEHMQRTPRFNSCINSTLYSEEVDAAMHITQPKQGLLLHLAYLSISWLLDAICRTVKLQHRLQSSQGIQPMRLPYHPFALVAQQVPNLPKETKGNSMLIPLFHSLPLCSPKKASESYTMATFALSLCKPLCNSSSRCLQSKEGKFQALICPHNRSISLGRILCLSLLNTCNPTVQEETI